MNSRVFGFGNNDPGRLWPSKLSLVFRFLVFCLPLPATSPEKEKGASWLSACFFLFCLGIAFLQTPDTNIPLPTPRPVPAYLKIGLVAADLACPFPVRMQFVPSSYTQLFRSS